VRIVATQAALALVERLMLETGILRLAADIFVAFETEFIAGFAENEGVVGTMGVVTGDAIALDHDLVGAARFIRYHTFMATAAKCGHIRYQQFFMG